MTINLPSSGFSISSIEPLTIIFLSIYLMVGSATLI